MIDWSKRVVKSTTPTHGAWICTTDVEAQELFGCNLHTYKTLAGWVEDEYQFPTQPRYFTKARLCDACGRGTTVTRKLRRVTSAVVRVEDPAICERCLIPFHRILCGEDL